MNQASEVVLTRTGTLPLKLTGEKLAGVSTDLVNGRDRDRWHEIDVYQASKFVAHVKWRSKWKGEQPYDCCFVDDTLKGLTTQILAYDPLEFLVGYPEGSQFERKQERLEQSITDDWSAMISDLFVELDVTESL